MARGDIVTVAAGSGYGGKPRPAVVVQSDDFSQNDSLTICLLTTVVTDAPLVRLRIEPTPRNGLRAVSWIMVDKIITVPRANFGPPIGVLDPSEIEELDVAILQFLGLAT